MKVGSLFAGIGGFDLGFERAGFEVAWCVEIDRNARAVLARRFPKARILEDVTKVDPHDLETVDVICGGFPCQDLSVAGKRAGLAGARSGLFHDAMRIVRTLRPRLLVLENVPGLLSSNHGRDFATVLREVGEGWSCEEVAWRVLDSQFFGVAQRRRRVFVVAIGHSRIGCAEEVLALAESSGGNPPSRGKARKGVAADAARCADSGRQWPAEVAPTLNCAYADKMGLEDQHALNGAGHFVPQAAWLDGSDCAATLTKQNANGAQRMPDKGNIGAVMQPFSPHGHYRYEASEQASTLQSRENRQGGHTHLVATGDTRTTHAIAIPIQDGRDIEKNQNGLGVGSDGDSSYTLDATGSQSIAIGVDVYNGIETGQIAATLTVGTGGVNGSGPKAIAFNRQNGGGQVAVAFAQNQVGEIRTSETMSTIGTTGNASARTTPKIMSGIVVRRLTPVECERLQGFPDGWTDIGTDKPTADSHRYKQLGNAVTVNVAEWIARRAHEALTKEAL